MKIATMTSLFYNRREDGELPPMPESIARCRAAGFDVLDLNMCPMDVRRRQYFCGDDWEERVDEVLEAIEENQVTIYSSHPPCRPGLTTVFQDPEVDAFFRRMERRSLEITARAGGAWAVVHPVCDPELGADYDAQIALNHRIYDEVVEFADKLGIGIAFENTVQFPGAPYRFAAVSEELIALCDSYHSPNVGICWDFGHGNLMYPGFSESALRPLGKRLKVTHVHDNLGVRDDHFLPFVGNIRWEKLMPILKEIGYEGTLNLEISLSHRMPDMLRDEAARLAYNTTKILLNMAEG